MNSFTTPMDDLSIKSGHSYSLHEQKKFVIQAHPHNLNTITHYSNSNEENDLSLDRNFSDELWLEDDQTSSEKNLNSDLKANDEDVSKVYARTRNFKARVSPNEADENNTEIYSQAVIEEIKTLAVSYKRDWKKISKRIFTLHKVNIDHFQLRMIYKRESSPHQGKPIKFSDEEDVILMNAIEEVGLDWVQVSKYFADRSPLSLRNRYFLILREGRMKKSKSKVASKQKKGGSSKAACQKINLKMKIADLIFDEKPAWMELIEKLSVEN